LFGCSCVLIYAIRIVYKRLLIIQFYLLIEILFSLLNAINFLFEDE